MKQHLIVLLLLLLLAACALPNPTPTPEAQSELIVTRVTATSTPTVENTATAVPPATSRFTPTYRPSATPRPSRAPQNTRPPTMTPTPTPTRFVIAAPSTPAGPPDSYQLKQWTEADAVTAVMEAQETLWGSHPLWNFGDFFDLTGYLDLVEHEALLRFVELPGWLEIAWDMLGIEYSPGWRIHQSQDLLSQLLGHALNVEGIRPDRLSNYLQKRDWHLYTSQPVDNLLGNQESGILLLLETAGVWGGPWQKGALLLLTADQAGEYQLRVIQEVSGSYPDYEILPIEDHNGNGIPEIGLLAYNYFSGIPAPCSVKLYLLEWQTDETGGHFVDLARDVQEFWTTSDQSWCEEIWHFEADTNQGASTLVERQQYVIGDDCPDLVRSITYAWNGEQYAWEKSEIEPLPPDISTVCAIQWAGDADETSDQAIAILENALTDWPGAMNELWGPASADYFRLKLGTWYDLRGQSASARQMIQSVRDTPAAEYTLVSELARAYLAARQSYGLYAACTASNQTLETALAEIPFADWGRDLAVMLEMWEFAAPKWWAYGPDPICDMRTAFRVDAQSLPPGTDEQAVMDWLNGVGVSWTTVSPADLNNDGLNDWLILTSLNNSATSWDLWAFVQNETGYAPLYVDWLYTHERPSGIIYHSFQLPAGLGTMHIVAADRTLTAFTLSLQGDGWRVRELLSYYGGDTAVTNIRLIQTDTNLSLFIVENSVEKQYDWFPDTATFKHVASNPPTQAEQISHIEQIIFQQSAYQQAIAHIQALLAQGIVEPQRSSDETYVEPARVEPHLRYLLGLCYELTGDADKAVAAYWQVWRDFPDNLYALSARRKLEPITP